MIFRYARHTSNLDNNIVFYTKVIGLEIIGNFKDHDGYDGVFLGKQGKSWHLEFTVSKDLPQHTSDEDDALVFYFNTMTSIEERLKIALSLNAKQVSAKNPYWNTNGVTILDPDGFRVILAVKK